MAWGINHQLITEKHKEVIANKKDLVREEIIRYNIDTDGTKKYESQEINDGVRSIYSNREEAERLKNTDPEKFNFYSKIIFLHMLEHNRRPVNEYTNYVVTEELDKLDKSYTDKIVMQELRKTIEENKSDIYYQALKTLIDLIDPNSQEAKNIKEEDKGRYEAYCQAVYVIASKFTPDRESFVINNGINSVVMKELVKQDIKFTGGEKFEITGPRESLYEDEEGMPPSEVMPFQSKYSNKENVR
jgi:hypothetical protein